MHITGRRKLDKFAKRHPTTRQRLERWSKLMEEGTYESITDLRDTFPQADPVPARLGKFSQPGERTTLTVFNIGRSVRLITFINYKRHEVSIMHVLTHEEYDRGGWKR